jgi:Type I restriction-modification system methyltransferase subunit
MDDITKLERSIRDMFSKAKDVDNIKLMNCCIAAAFLKDASESDEIELDLNIPDKARWDQLVKEKFDIGEALCVAFQVLENANTDSEGIFESFCEDFSVITENSKLESMFFKRMQNLSLISYSDVKLFDWMLHNIASNMKNGIGSYLTPEKLSKLMVSLLDPQEDMTVCDPVCRSGELLVKSESYLQAKNPNASLDLYGEEMDLNLWRIARLNLILHGHRQYSIFQGDAITEPVVNAGGNLNKFDRVISIPPFGKRDWGYKVARDDPFGRFRYGTPPKMTGDFAYIQHMLASLKSNGKMVTAVPTGILFRRGTEENIRTKIINNDLIEAIIQLPPKVLNYTSIPICLVIMNMDKPSEREGSILFISAEDDFQDTRYVAVLEDKGIKKIVDAYQGYKYADKYSRVVSTSEIADNNYNLTVSLYVDKSSEIESIDISKFMADIQALREQREGLVSEMQASLQKLGIIR